MTPVPSPKVVAPGAGKTVMLFGVRFSYKIESADSGGSLAVLEVQIPPRTLVKPHRHSREDEFSVVLEGTVGVRVADQVLTAGPGSYLVKPRATPHAMWNAASVPAKVIEILSPAGLEAYFEQLARSWPSMAPRRSTTSSGMPTASRSRTAGSRSWNGPTGSSSELRPPSGTSSWAAGLTA